MNSCPFELSVSAFGSDEKVTLTCVAVLRALPRKRFVYDAIWNGRDVIVKVFVDKYGAKRHFKHEWRGMNLLCKRDANSPKPLLGGRTADGSFVIAVEKVLNSATALETFQRAETLDYKVTLLRSVCALLAHYHEKGIVQEDMHLGNFLVQGEKIFGLDVAEMRFFSRGVNKSKSFSQVAHLLSALPEENDEVIRSILESYAAGRSLVLSPGDLALFFQKLAIVRDRNVTRRLKKCMRSSRLYVKLKLGNDLIVAKRSVCEKNDLPELAENIDVSMQNGQILKNESPCVSVIQLGDTNAIVKRYDCSGFCNRIRSVFRNSAARQDWLDAHTPNTSKSLARPLAFIERWKWFGVHKSYFISEYQTDA